jgi:hypothetical protein
LKAQAQWATHGETISKYWSRVNIEKTPRDIIYRINIPNSDCYTTKSEEMAEIAKSYHKELQLLDTLTSEENAQQEARLKSLKKYQTTRN